MKKLFLITALCVVCIIQANAQNNFIHTPKGALVKIFTSNTGDKIKLNDVVTFDAVQKTEKDSVLFSSYQLGHPLQIQVQASQNVSDLMDVFVLLTAKDSVYVKIPSDSLFKANEDQRPPFLPKGSWLVFTLKIIKVQSLQAAMTEVKTAEITATNNYIADNKLNVTTTSSGLKYLITQPSTKRKPLAGDTVLVNYTGRTLDGKVFDSSIETEAKKANLQQDGRKYEPIQVVLGAGSVIKGWEEGLLLINEGSKAKFIIPSSLAYGSQGAGADIAPYSTLVFDIELVKIKPNGANRAIKPTEKKTPTKKNSTTKKKN